MSLTVAHWVLQGAPKAVTYTLVPSAPDSLWFPTSRIRRLCRHIMACKVRWTFPPEICSVPSLKAFRFDAISTSCRREFHRLGSTGLFGSRWWDRNELICTLGASTALQPSGCPPCTHAVPSVCISFPGWSPPSQEEPRAGPL